MITYSTASLNLCLSITQKVVYYLVLADDVLGVSYKSAIYPKQSLDFNSFEGLSLIAISTNPFSIIKKHVPLDPSENIYTSSATSA